MGNPRAVWAFILAILALAVLFGTAYAARASSHVGLYESIAAVPIGFVLSFAALTQSRRARFENQRSLGRRGGSGLAVAARILGGIALLISITAALALGVFAVLTLVLQ